MINGFLRSAFRLRDLLNYDYDELDGKFSGVVALIGWHYDAKRGRVPDHTAALFGADVQRYNLILHLSTFDAQFRILSNRLATGSLLRRSPPPSQLELMFAADLLNADRLPLAKPLVARSALYNIAIRIAIEQGRHPTGESKTRRIGSDKPLSACELISKRLERDFGISVSYSVVESAWKARTQCLEKASFPTEQISDFLGKFIQ